MVGWHHRLNGHEFEQTLGDGEEQRSLVCCSPRGRKELDTTKRLNNSNKRNVKIGPEIKLSAKELMLLNCGAGEDS